MATRFRTPSKIDWPTVITLMIKKRSQRELGLVAEVHHQALHMLRHLKYDDMMCSNGLVLLDGFIQENGANHPAVADLPLVRLLNETKRQD